MKKKIHKALTELFKRLRLGNLINEWYPGNNYFIKTFITDIQQTNLKDALKRVNAVSILSKHDNGKKLYTIRELEKSLRDKGFSRNQSKKVISMNKNDIESLLDINLKDWKNKNAYH